MKKTFSWHDTFSNITNNIYLLENGVQLIESINPKTIEVDIDFLFGGGFFDEPKLGLPIGTAHFTEHMLCGPNSKYKSKLDIQNASKGNLSTPTFFPNASTGWRSIKFFANANAAGLERILEYIFAQIKYPTDRFSEFIEDERNIIMSEFYRLDKKEKNWRVGFNNTFFSNIYPEIREYVVGTDSSIKEIGVDHLKTFFDATISAKNLIISIQTPTILSDSVKTYIEQSVEALPIGESRTEEFRTLDTNFRVGSFMDEQANDVVLMLNKFIRVESQIDYTKHVTNYFVSSLVSEVTYNFLRDELSLIYSGGGFRQSTGLGYVNRGFDSSFRLDTMESFVDALETMLFSKIPEFISTNKSMEWFVSQKSKYIFQLNQSVSSDYAYGIATDIKNGFELGFQFDESIKIASSIEKELVEKEYLDWLQEDFCVWLMSSIDKDELQNKFTNTNLYKRIKK